MPAGKTQKKRMLKGTIRQSRETREIAAITGLPKHNKTAAGRYIANLMMMPLDTPRKQLIFQAGISNSHAQRIENVLREQLIYPVKAIYFPDFTKLGFGRKGKTTIITPAVRAGLIPELIELIKRNPYGQLPSSRLAKKYGFRNAKSVCRVAERIRRQLGFTERSVSRGGARLRYPEQVRQIISEFIQESKKTKNPVSIRELIIEIAKRTRSVVSPESLRGRIAKSGVRVSLNGIPAINGKSKNLDSSLRLLRQNRLKPGRDFDTPVRRRLLAGGKKKWERE